MMDLQTKEEEGSTAGPSRVASALARTSEGETRPPWGAGSHTQWATVGAI
jgi:hypothetical protein